MGVFAGGRADVIPAIWPKCPQVRWVHALSAGVDALCPLLRALPRVADGNVPVTNAKGAYSSSLAEYALTAMLHFNKQIPRVQANRAAGRWEKFLMSELRGQTAA